MVNTQAKKERARARAYIPVAPFEILLKSNPNRTANGNINIYELVNPENKCFIVRQFDIFICSLSNFFNGFKIRRNDFPANSTFNEDK